MPTLLNLIGTSTFNSAVSAQASYMFGISTPKAAAVASAAGGVAVGIMSELFELFNWSATEDNLIKNNYLLGMGISLGVTGASVLADVYVQKKAGQQIDPEFTAGQACKLRLISGVVTVVSAVGLAVLGIVLAAGVDAYHNNA